MARGVVVEGVLVEGVVEEEVFSVDRIGTRMQGRLRWE